MLRSECTKNFMYFDLTNYQRCLSQLIDKETATELSEGMRTVEDMETKDILCELSIAEIMRNMEVCVIGQNILDCILN